jgi:prepilin-type processing-associated H-X9-DG protein
MKCQNNLKQIALGLHNYHDANSKFPPGEVATNMTTGASANFQWSWPSLLLPYIEQGNLFNLAQAGVGTAPQPTATTDPRLAATRTGVPIYICPSDTGDVLNTYLNGYAKTNYVMCKSIEAPTYDPPNPKAYNFKAQTRMADIVDGTSNSFLLAERASPIFPGAFLSEGGIWACEFGTNNSHSFDEEPINSSISPALLTAAGLCCQGNSVNDPNNYRGAATSFHTNGINTAFCDGSIHFIQATIDLTIYKNLYYKKDGAVNGPY